MLSTVMAQLGADLLAVEPEVAFVGPDQRDETGKPPRVVWQVAASQRRPPARIGGGPNDDGAIATRQWAVQVEFWHETFEQLEALVDRFLGIVHDRLTHHGSPPQGDETWAHGGVTAAGDSCRLVIFVNAPVLRTPRPTRPVVPTPVYKLDDTAV